MSASARPTIIRYVILALVVCVAVLLYLDRFCLGFVTPYIRENLRLTDDETNFLLGAFFYTYAFGQIPCGWLSDRFGTRLMLAIYLAIWSTLTGLTGLAQGFVMLMMFRFGCGLFEAGAYPSCAGLIRRWIPYQQRGLASGVVSIGGRLGGTVAPVVTAYLMVLFLPLSSSSLIREQDILHPRRLARKVLLMPEEEIKYPEIVQEVALRLQKSMTAETRRAFVEMADLPEKDADARAERMLHQKSVMTAAINDWLQQKDLTAGIDLQPLHAKLNKQALKLFEPSSTPRSEEEITRRNRFLLEVLFPSSLRKIYGDSWQPVLMIYGAAGVLLALVFWSFYRDSPRQHFLSNEAEAQLVEAHVTAAESAAPPMPASDLWWGILTSPSLWASAVVQFGTNFGWIFLGNMLPTYLVRVHQVPEVTRGWMTSLTFMVSLPMLLVGGWWTDRMTKKYGPRWGRCIPMASTRFVGAAAFLICTLLDAPWPITIALCVFSIFSDMGLPAMWAYNLDVGGRNVGVVLGWGNMWGNLGAAVSSSILGFVLQQFVDPDKTSAPEELKAGYNAVFMTCAAVFFVIGIASFFVDATKPIGKRAEVK